MSKWRDIEANLAAQEHQLKALLEEAEALERGEASSGVAEQLAARPSADDSYESITRSNREYLRLHDIQDIDIDSLLGPAGRRAIDDEYFAPIARMRSWDRWDYVTVGAAGMAAGLLDMMLVRQPKPGTYKGVRYAGSPLTKGLRERFAVPSDNPLARWCKNTPYDSFAIDGMTPRDHRLRSIGHDPALGWLVGIHDIMTGSVTGVDRGQNIVSKTGVGKREPAIVKALIMHVAHLLSDVFTPMGLPPPFFTVLHAIKLGSFGPKGRNFGEVIRWMYLNGYDLRHFLVQGLCGPALVEIIIRTVVYLRIRLQDGYHGVHYSDINAGKRGLFHQPKYRSMLFWGHAVATLCNAGKVALQQGNPLAINYAQWLALFRYLIPQVETWMTGKSELRLARLFQRVTEGWDELLAESERAAVALHELDSDIVYLRTSAQT